MMMAIVGMVGCGEPEPRSLAELVVRDSLYVDPDTELPYSGPVYRAFAHDSEGVELEGQLLDGTWHGELRVYHSNGRLRYMGSFEQGERCGAWTENADSVPTGSLYEEVVREVETMGLYPPCESARGSRGR